MSPPGGADAPLEFPRIPLAGYRLVATGPDIPGEFSINLRVFGYAILLIVFFGVFSGVYPAWKMSRLHPVVALRGRSR